MTSPTDKPVIQVDGRRPLSAELVADLAAVCDRAEDGAERDPVLLHASGAPEQPPDRGINTALVSKWERVLRRLERVPAATVVVATGECGGTALDALLTTDYRIATASTRLLVPAWAQATWPGMALYRLVQQAGAAAARRAVLFGVPIAAADALKMHLIDELAVGTAAALMEARKVAEAIPGPELAIRRQLMQDAAAVSFEEALGAHLAACDRMLRQTTAGTVP